MVPTKYEVDVAKYAKIETGEDDITLTWEEARDIFRVVVVTSEPGTLSNIKLQYWQNHWPHQRVPKGAVIGAGRTGWMAQDDWYNGKWKDADFRVLLEGTDVDAAKNVFPIAFKPINVREFPDIKDFKAIYRRTMKLRLLFRGERQGIDKIEAYTDSIWKETEIKIEWGDDFAPQDWQGHFSIYNGELIGVESLTDNVKIDDENQISCNNKKGSIKAKLRFTYNEDINSFDKTIVTFRTTARSFSFLIDEVESGQKIFIKDFDILVTKHRDNISYKAFREEWEKNHKLTVYDRIKNLPEQTYNKSWNDMPKKKSRGFMPVGCDGGRQKFAVDQNGDVFYRKNWISRVKGKDTDRILWDGEEIRHSFGFPNVEPIMRHRIDGYLPMIYGRWEDQGIAYEQTAFVTLLGKDVLSGERMEGDDPTILLAKITLTNLQNNSQTVRLHLKSKCSVEEKLEEENGFIFAANYEPRRMRYFLDTAGKGLFKMEDSLQYLIELEKNESHSIYLKIPFITLVNDEEYEIAKNIDYDVEFAKVKKIWQDRVFKGSQINVPNQILNNFYSAHLTHILITDDREVGSHRYASRVGTFPYGVFPDESVMCISDLDRRGYKQEAEERLEMLIHYQGTVGVPATFSTVEGQYYGAGGYECGGYNKSHGWVLWGLGEHYWYHRDQEWLKRIAPSIIKACDWIINERRSTMKHDSYGKKVLEYG
ncbi:hypothetical protein FJZ33_07490, partial [Candidatus Poribacteria bacterium]|nr:hypothetical protein [Candidatus Poribacteria bacterium]